MSRDVNAGKLRAYEKALQWYASPDNWAEQSHSAAGQTTSFRWATEDQGALARHALAVWKDRETPPV